MELTELEVTAREFNVDLPALKQKINDGLMGANISHFTDGELEVIWAAFEIAGEL